MNKNVMRLAAFMLLPCLLVDPATASLPVVHQAVPPLLAQFGRETLAPRDISFTFGKNLFFRKKAGVFIAATTGVLTIAGLNHAYPGHFLPGILLSFPGVLSVLGTDSKTRRTVDIKKVAKVAGSISDDVLINSHPGQTFLSTLNSDERYVVRELLFIREQGLSPQGSKRVNKERVDKIVRILLSYREKKHSPFAIIKNVRKYLIKSQMSGILALPEINSRNLPASTRPEGPGWLTRAS